MTTKKGLASSGPILFALLFGLIVAAFANMFFQSSAVEWQVSLAGVIIFMGLILCDVKKIKEMNAEGVVQGDALAISRISAIGAVNLYLDLTNLFTFTLSIVVDRK